MKKLHLGVFALTAALVMPFAAACGGGGGQALQYDEAAPAYQDADATLSLSGSLDLSSPEKQISPDLFGLFLEDINYAGFALDDNLLANGSFDSTGVKTECWEGNNVTVTAENTQPLFGEEGYSGFYAKLNVTAAGGTLTNSGYRWVPMYVENETEYLFSCFIKNYAGEITVSAKAGSDVFASDTFSVSESEDWVKYERTVKAGKTGRENVVFELSFGSADSDVCLDAVKFETLDSTCGMKNYLFNVLRDLSPAFFRFPGGCVIEGKSNSMVYDWKNSVGAIAKDGDDAVPEVTYKLVKDGKESTQTTRGEQAARKQNGDLWKRVSYYDFEYGIGFYEFFELCDALGAKAIPIVNCGLSCQIQTEDGAVALAGRHGNRVEDFIQDALDLVAFAKGDVNSSDPDEAYWAGLRADMGHAKPFEMDYIGIGNEQWGDYYSGYYEKFLEAFKEKEKENPLYGTVKLIVGNGPNFQYDVQYGYDPETKEWARRGTAYNAANGYIGRSGAAVDCISDYGVVDHHYYMNYTDFLETADMYDDYLRKWDGDTGARNAYDVFVGEYAANTNFTRSEFQNGGKISSFTQVKNGWLTALSEAAFMTGLERNGDIVKLAAYAPMFGTFDTAVGDALQWETDMMYFTGESVVLTNEYYVQQLFMKNSGDAKLFGDLSFASGKSMPQTEYEGVDAPGDKPTSTRVTRTFDDIYYVTSYDSESKDVLVKIVNVGQTDLKLNVKVGVNGLSLEGVAQVTVLHNDDPEVSFDRYECAVFPKTTRVGGFTDGTIGCSVPKYSVVALRIPTK